MQIAGHHGEAGRDDATFVARTGDDVERDGGPHVEDDRWHAVVFLHGDGVGDAVLADFRWPWIGELQSTAALVCQVQDRQAKALDAGL